MTSFLICPICSFETPFPHDRRPDNSGLDDGLDLPTRKKASFKSADVMTQIRARAWMTRRAKYGERGHG